MKKFSNIIFGIILGLVCLAVIVTVGIIVISNSEKKVTTNDRATVTITETNKVDTNFSQIQLNFEELCNNLNSNQMNNIYSSVDPTFKLKFDINSLTEKLKTYKDCKGFTFKDPIQYKLKPIENTSQVSILGDVIFADSTKPVKLTYILRTGNWLFYDISTDTSL